MTTPLNEPASPSPYAVFRLPSYRRYFIGNVLGIIAHQMLTLAVAWEIYERTGSKLKLGYIGLAQYLPILLFTLPAGQIADRFNRKKIMFLTLTMTAIAALAMLWVSATNGSINIIYACLFLNGLARAFQAPARAAFVTQIVPREIFPNAVAWGSNSFEIATITGPALGGAMIAFFGKPTWVYLVTAVCSLTYLILLTGIQVGRPHDHREPIRLEGLLAGLRFVWRSKVMVASITLDLFAVLLGGAVTLLPIYAKDILQVGPTGLGWMRAAPSVGAIVMAFIIAHRPPMQKAGWTLLVSVVGFGLATIVFGLSRTFWLSMAMLVLIGAFDSISVIIRHTLVQMLTPDEMRGRVSAINSLFIGTSNELGGYESGLVAEYFGTVTSVVSGGIGTLLVVLIVGTVWPQLRRYGALVAETK
ncbi:MAG TPA: MFS transporter [Blastocatellia bacterium]|nr:MFS transporter [Blastocatellia bacterium]